MIAMIDEETRRKLRGKNMGEMVEALDLQEADRTCMGMPFDERAHDGGPRLRGQALVQREATHPAGATPLPGRRARRDDLRGTRIDGVLVREALTRQFMDRADNSIVEGCTGTGKSYLACCMAKQACRMRRSTRYIRLPDLLMERDELAATERSDAKIQRKYARYELLVIDEWLTEDVEDVAIRFLLELVEGRYMDRSTVLCTQYSPADWHGRLGGGVQADAMIDRLVHGAVRIDLGDVNVRNLPSEKK